MGHIITGNLKIIADSQIRSVISKGPKHRFPAHTCIDFNKCWETIASALNDYCTRWCKQEHVESNALNNWKCVYLSVSSYSLCLGWAAACDCGTPWTFLLPFLPMTPRGRTNKPWHVSKKSCQLRLSQQVDPSRKTTPEQPPSNGQQLPWRF